MSSLGQIEQVVLLRSINFGFGLLCAEALTAANAATEITSRDEIFISPPSKAILDPTGPNAGLGMMKVMSIC